MASLQEAVKSVDAKIEEEYQQIVLREYTPLFDSAINRASSHMDSKNIREIRLCGISYTNLCFRDGNFYHHPSGSLSLGAKRRITLQELPNYYQDEAKVRHEVIDYHKAMRTALTDFVESVRTTLSSA